MFQMAGGVLSGPLARVTDASPPSTSHALSHQGVKTKGDVVTKHIQTLPRNLDDFVIGAGWESADDGSSASWSNSMHATEKQCIAGKV